MKYILIGLIRVYQMLPFKSHSKCKFIPTCSNYGIEAINTYGSIKGSILTIKRIIRCNPLTEGGYDPLVKEKKMKKIKSLFIGIILLGLTGCFKNDSMEDINIVTSSYPIEYVVSSLYGNHSTITSIYPKDDESIDFEVTDVLLEQYSDSDLFIFNGLSDEKNYVKKMSNNNEELMIIDVTSNMNTEYSMEELWLDPNNLLTIANNVRKGFKEYINSTYLTDEVDANYENLKIELTSLDGKYYSTAKNASNTTIIVSDDAFLFLEKYGIKVISIDPDSAKDKAISDAEDLIKDGTCKYLFIKYKEDNEKINEFLNETGAKKLELYTMTNLKDIDVEKNNYISLMNQNLENLKLELYK